MKILKRMIVLVFCFVLLSNSLIINSYALNKNPFAEYNLSFNDVPTPYEDLVDVLDPYAVMPLVEPLYDFYATNDFSLTEAITTSKSFLYWEDLPYGLDTIVISYSVSNTVYFLFLDGEVLNAMQQTWSTIGNCRIVLTSNSPIYRIGYNRSTGSCVSFYSKTGLACDHTEVLELENETVYGFAYTLAAGDYYVCISPNRKNLYTDMYLNDEHADAIYSSGNFPKKADISFDLQKEQNETSKSIWDTLKSVLEYIINLPSNIAESIRSFFTNLGDRISTFFTSLGDRISSFFTTLKNYILYFSAEAPEDNGDETLEVNTPLSSLKTYCDDLITDTDDFVSSLDETFENIKSYISTGSGVINSILNGVPVLNFFILFFLIFSVIRKVVGR